MIDTIARAAYDYYTAGGYHLSDAIDRAIADAMTSTAYPTYIYSRVAAKVYDYDRLNA